MPKRKLCAAMSQKRWEKNTDVLAENTPSYETAVCESNKSKLDSNSELRLQRQERHDIGLYSDMSMVDKNQRVGHYHWYFKTF
jgi:hypothetical protein